MTGLFRFVAVAVVVGLVIYFVRRMMQQSKSGGPGQLRAMPFCRRCESNRNVVVNAGRNPRYPQDRWSWYCQRCDEGF